MGLQILWAEWRDWFLLAWLWGPEMKFGELNEAGFQVDGHVHGLGFRASGLRFMGVAGVRECFYVHTRKFACVLTLPASLAACVGLFLSEEHICSQRTQQQST